MDETTRQAILAIADLIQTKLDEGADRQYILEDALARLDLLAGDDEPRGQLVWDKPSGLLS